MKKTTVRLTTLSAPSSHSILVSKSPTRILTPSRSPWSTLKTPSGRPASFISSARRIETEGSGRKMSWKKGGGPYESTDPDTSRVWWTDVGVHQNLTFQVNPDPISGMHCWHQAVTVAPADPDDRYGDVFVDLEEFADEQRGVLDEEHNRQVARELQRRVRCAEHGEREQQAIVERLGRLGRFGRRSA